MFHFIFHFFMQVITLPSQITDLATWLLIPAVMGIIANSLVNGAVSLAPKTLTPIATGIKLIVYIGIAVISVALANVNPSQLAEWNPLFVAIMAAIAAFIGDKTSTVATNALFAVGRVASALTVRLALGRDAAKAFFDKDLAHG